MKTIGVSLLMCFAASAYAAEMTDAGTATPAGGSAAAASAPTPAATRAGGAIARAAITSAVVDREPTDNLSQIASDKERIYYFTEVKDMAGQTVTHRWEHNGQTVSEVKFDIGGPRWRVYSSKTLPRHLTGEWKVSVIDANGATVGANTFTYASAATAQPAAQMGETAQPTPATLNAQPANTPAPTTR